jgi:hypothetical protein
MKIGDLIRFIATGVVGVVVEKTEYKALVYSAWEEEETNTEQTGSFWYSMEYLRDVAQPATLDYSAMRGGTL